MPATEKLYRISIGDSTDGPMGAEIVVVATSEAAARARAEKLIEASVSGATGGIMVFSGMDWDSGELRSQEYCQVYFNPKLGSAFDLKVAKARVKAVEDGEVDDGDEAEPDNSDEVPNQPELMTPEQLAAHRLFPGNL